MFTNRKYPEGGGVKMPLDAPAQSPLPYGLFAAGLKVYPLLLDVARTSHKLSISGNVLWAYRASSLTAVASIQFNTLEGDNIEYREGLFIAGAKFSSLYVTHTAQAGQYLMLLYTEDASREMRVFNSNMGAATVMISKSANLVSTADVVMGATGRTLVLAANTNIRTAIITNLPANANTFRIGDVSCTATRGAPLKPGETISLDTTDDIQGWNPALAENLTCVYTED